MRRGVCTVVVFFALTLAGYAQFEVGGGYVHVSGNQGLDGFNAAGALWFSPRVAIGVDYDMAWDSSTLGVFENSTIGLTSVKSRLQDFLIGPRISIPGLLHSEQLKGNALLPFIEVQVGASDLSSTITQQNVGSASSSDTRFTWMFGGGADFKLSPAGKWFARIKVDLLRTHFVSTGQSRLRFGIGVAHTSRPRIAPVAAAGARDKEDKEKERAEIRKMSQETQALLYETQPSAKAAVENAFGYAVFSNTGIKILLAGSGRGAGIAINNQTKQETFMKMLELQAGLGFGFKKFRVIFVFDNQKAFDGFLNSGWQFGGQATAAAKTSPEKGGSMEGAVSVSDGVWMYQLTDKGLALELTGKGTKYSKDEDLN